MNPYDDPVFFDAYAQMDRSRQGLAGAGEWRQLKSLFPDLEGKTVLDLGCGYGWHCQYAADMGAKSVLGIDQSEKMIGKAQLRNGGSRIEYRVCDILEYDYPAQQFDLVISNLALHYLEDLDAVYRMVHRTLKDGGQFLFNIEHPTFTAGVNQQWVMEDGKALYWPVDRYYYPGPRVTDFLGHSIRKYHHTLEQILNGLLRNGFSLEAVEEAMPPEQWHLTDEMRRPMMLLVSAVKKQRDHHLTEEY